MQRNDGLPGTRAAVDDSAAAGVGAHDRVLVALDGRQRTGHAAGAAGGERRQERALRVRQTCVLLRREVEPLVPRVHDASVGPAKAPPAEQAERRLHRRREEGLGLWGAPVDEQHVAVRVAQPEPADVRPRAGPAVHAAEADVATQTREHRDPAAERVRLSVALQPSLAGRHLLPAQRVETLLQLADPNGEEVVDGLQVHAVGLERGQCGRGEAGVVDDGQGVLQGSAQATSRQCAAEPWACRKPPSVGEPELAGRGQVRRGATRVGLRPEAITQPGEHVAADRRVQTPTATSTVESP